MMAGRAATLRAQGLVLRCLVRRELSSGSKSAGTLIECLQALSLDNRVQHQKALKWFRRSSPDISSLSALDAGLVLHRAVVYKDWDTALRLLRQQETPVVTGSLDAMVGQCCKDNRADLALMLIDRYDKLVDGKRLLSPESYAAAIGMLGRSGRHREALELVREGSKAASFLGSEGFVYQAMISLAGNGAWKEALHMFRTLTDDGKRRLENGWCYGAAVRACGCGDQAEEGARLLRLAWDHGHRLGTRACNSVLQACARLRRPDLASEVMKEMKARRLIPDEASYQWLMTAYRSTRQSSRCLSLFHDMLHVDNVTPSDACFVALVDCLSRCSQWYAIPPLLQQLGPRATPDMFRDSMAVLTKAGCWQQCEEVEGQMRALGMEDRSRHEAGEMALQALVVAGQWRRAVRAWHQLEQQNERGPRPSLKTMEMVLDACAHGQCWEDATAAMAALARHGHSPSLACYQSLLTICAKTGRAREALDLLQKAEAAGLSATRDVSCLRSVMQACRASGSWELGLEVVSSWLPVRKSFMPCVALGLETCGEAGQWRLALDRLEEWEHRGWPLDSACYRAVLDACAKAGQWREAMGVLRRMLDKPHVVADADAFQPVIWACAKADRLGEAMELFDTMADRGVSRNGRCYVTVLNVLERTGDWERALSELRQGLKDGSLEGLSASAMRIVVRTCFKAGRWREALAVVALGREKHGILVTAEDYLCVKAIEKLVQQEGEGAAVAKEVVQLLEEWVRVVRDTPGVRAVNKALEVLSQRGQWDVCLSLLRGGMARRFHAHPDCASYSTVMHAMASADVATSDPGVPPPEQLLDEMRRVGLQPDTVCYNVVLNALRRRGRWREAVDLLHEMKTKAQDGGGADVYSYATAMAACNENGQWPKTLELLQELEGRGLRPNVVVYGAVMEACARGRQWTEAIGLLERLRAEGVQPSTALYGSVLSVCRNVGRWREALDVLRVMAEAGPPPESCYAAVIHACGRAGQWEEVVSLMDEMRAKAVASSARTYTVAIASCGKAGAGQAAVGLFRRMTEEDGTAPDLRCCHAVLSACAEAGLWEEATAVLARMRRQAGGSRPGGQGGQQSWPRPDAASYRWVMEACSAAHRWEEHARVRDEALKSGVRFGARRGRQQKGGEQQEEEEEEEEEPGSSSRRSSARTG